MINFVYAVTIADSPDGNGTPSALILSDVEDVVEFDSDISKPLEERGRRPLGVFQVNFLPIAVLTIDIEITGFVGLTPTIEANINTAVTAFLADVRPFVAGADVLINKNDIISVNRLIVAVQNAILTENLFNTLTFDVNGSPGGASFQFLNGDIPFLGTITFI